MSLNQRFKITGSNLLDSMFSLVVGRGIVVHAENAGGGRLACGTIKPVAALYVEKTLRYVEGAGFSQ